jgi:hypothetical protein
MTALLVLLWPVLLLLAVTGGVGVLGGFCYHWWREDQAERAACQPDGYPGG